MEVEDILTALVEAEAEDIDLQVVLLYLIQHNIQ